jgi:hypothetical protein
MIEQRQVEGSKWVGEILLGLLTVPPVVWFGLGLLAPLTPSKGRHSLLDLLTWVVLPAAVLSQIGFRARTGVLKGLVIVQVGLVVIAFVSVARVWW